MKMITLKLEDGLLSQMDGLSSDFGFSSRTEFIRNALRDKVEEYRLKQAILKLEKSKGALKIKHSSAGGYESAREVAFEKIASRFK
ncbi:MAG: ribbon-helix-helix domain-containing protein [Candidatus Altiarchaeota archaeon]